MALPKLNSFSIQLQEKKAAMVDATLSADDSVSLTTGACQATRFTDSHRLWEG